MLANNNYQNITNPFPIVTKNRSFPLPRELSFIGNVQLEIERD